jgi:KaiC/GvpD/RAD55 family RecA-like ATPase
MVKESKTKTKKVSGKNVQQVKSREYVKTGIIGLDQLFEKGIPKNSNILIAGGAGSGKTIMCLQILNSAAKEGKKCIYMSFEENEERLREHMEDFGWDAKEMESSGKLVIKRFSSFDISKSMDAMMAKQRGELLIDMEPLIIPKGFTPEIVVLDSLSAISSYFLGNEQSYRSYIEQLFRFFEDIGATSFLISETGQELGLFSRSGVEEFLADGVIAIYNIRKGDVRESAIEVIKMRGAHFKKRVVAMQIVSASGIEVFPEQEVFAGLENVTK